MEGWRAGGESSTLFLPPRHSAGGSDRLAPGHSGGEHRGHRSAHPGGLCPGPTRQGEVGRASLRNRLQDVIFPEFHRS